MQRKNYHKKNVSSVAVTARTKRTSQQKSKQKQRADASLRKKIKSRCSFASPNRKDSMEKVNYRDFTLLNYMLLKEKVRGNVLVSKASMSRDMFWVKEVLGKGGFGRVMKVQCKKNSKFFAMKEMSKTVIVTKKSIQSVLNERQLLAELKHPFLVNMIHAFQDRDNLYLVMDLMPGGDLRYQIGQYHKFPEHIVKFFVCCILLGLDYLHQNNIIHRDIKPENLVIDSKGFLRITDLGVARISTPNNYKDTSGTPGYMAPEVIRSHNHTFPVDFFALGIIAYQCMQGRRPYRGANRQEIREQMIMHEVQIKPNQIPEHWSQESAELINSLIKRKEEQRLGTKGIREIMAHAWFKDINWDKMLNKAYPSPFMPDMKNKNYDTVSDSEIDEAMEHKLTENKLLLRRPSVQDLFNGYQYTEVKLF